MKRILSVFLLIAMTVSTFAILPAQAAAPITSTEEDSIVPSPWDSIETEGGAFSSEIEEAGLTYAAQGAENLRRPFLFPSFSRRIFQQLVLR